MAIRFDLTGKVAIVTGSSSGAGAAIAEVFAEQGAQVIVTGRTPKRAQEVVDGIIAKGGKAVFHALESSQEESIKTLIEDTVAQFGKIDILVNNAAGTTAHGATDIQLAKVPTDVWDDVMATDLRSVYLACRYAIPYMQKNGGGVILNTGSGGTSLGNRSQAAYSVAKGAIDVMTRNIACQYGKDNIRCNCIRPGLIVTPDNEPRIPQTLKDIFLSNIMVNRYGCPEDIGHACVYFGSDESAYVSGQVITVDGGLNSHVPTVAQFRAINSRTW